MTSLRWAVRGLSASLLVAGPASAQVGDGLIVQSQIRQNFDRSRNVSVEEQPRPDFSALGTHLGSFRLYPRVEIGAGGTSNTYLTERGSIASPTAYLRPSARLSSDWSRHRLQITGAATLRNYLGESPRNERVWNVGAEARLDVHRTLTVEAEASASRSFENLFSGEVLSSVAALSRYRRDFASLQATYTNGRGRAFVLADYTDLRFSPVPLLAGGIRDQGSRDRHIARVTGQVEYARSSSVSLFGQVSGSQTSFDQDLPAGEPNLDSDAVRVLGGANIDIAGRVRGTIGVGYSVRNYDAAAYDTIRGVSVESRIQLFPLRRLTLTLAGERAIEDSTLNNRSRFWNTSGNVRADYEVLRNLILNATADYSHQNYIDAPLSSDIYRAGLGGRYLASRRVHVLGSLSYSHRTSNNTRVQSSLGEARGEVGIAYQL